MPPNRFESEVESFLEGSHGDRTHIKRAGHHTVTPLCGTLLSCHRLWAPQLDFSGPSGAIHTSDAWRAVCCQARRCDSGQALPPPTGTAALSARLLWV